LQEAAVCFAKGDSDTAEVLLLGLFQGADIDASEADVLASALFDLYRATGQQDGFDVVAMDYAERFGRSPGEWFSVPASMSRHAAATASASSRQEDADSCAVWLCPSLLDEAALSELQTRFSKGTLPWAIDWSALTSIDASVCHALSIQVAHWCTQTVTLHWSGVDALLQELESKTPLGDKNSDPLWWSSRLDLLRILGQQEAFEALALDYCITYEVSPPSWTAPRCKLVSEQLTTDTDASVTGPPSIFSQEMVDRAAQDTRCELSGEVLGDTARALERLRAATRSSTQVTVSCALLARIDLAAAEGIMRWAQAASARGCYIEFERVPRLVAVLLQTLGLEQHAKIAVRTN
jgi:ABC-type transporter Mla MlaB component